MAAESNTSFLGPALNRHAISFQLSAINSTTEMIPMGSYFGGLNSTASMIMPANSNIINNNLGVSQPGNSSGSLLADSVPGLNHDTELAVEWSVEEQNKLDEGLVKFADEPSIMRYIKIAATLRDKTVRDVALRCRWIARKRRKQEEHIVGKKLTNRKDKLVESSSRINISSVPPLNIAAYPLMMHHMDQNERLPLEVSALTGAAKHLLEQNFQVLNQITANLSTFKLQDNIDLFCHTRNNIIAVLNDMRDMPGIMSRMPPLPVSINEDLANNILPNMTQKMFGSPNGILLKQEPGC